MGKIAEDYEYLVELRDRFLQSIRRGDTEEALDASVEVMAHHGIVRGDTKQLQMALAASGVIDSMQDRRRAASLIADSAAKALVASNTDSEKSEEPDYQGRMADYERGKETVSQEV